jgi:hypothetical protein
VVGVHASIAVQTQNPYPSTSSIQRMHSRQIAVDVPLMADAEREDECLEEFLESIRWGAALRVEELELRGVWRG